jgi:membrane protease YdiL (CAAX protease family)
MSTSPEPSPNDPEKTPDDRPVESSSMDPLAPVNTPAPPGEWTGEPEEPNPQPGTTSELTPPPPAEEIPHQPIFVAYRQPPPAPREERIPNLGSVGLLILLGAFGWLGIGLLLVLALQIHLWGVTTFSVAATDFRYNLASQAAQYLITFGACLAVFPIVWHRSFFDGIHWNGSFAVRRAGRLVSAAVLCFFVALINGVLMPGPENAPIDQLFKAPGAAWVFFAFGVTVAPFFEEMAFRGFLLPAFCTAFDWVAEQATPGQLHGVDSSGRPKWKPGASVIAVLVVGIPFLALIPRPEGHMTERILFVLAWASSMGVWWVRSLENGQNLVPPIDSDYHPRWSVPAMAVVSLLTSIPFAMMHGAQTSWSLGPFLLLIFVSLVLCWVRLGTRSLAASTIVHACYNLMLFLFMLLSTGGFRHLDKM